jgi:hypothetical protein
MLISIFWCKTLERIAHLLFNITEFIMEFIVWLGFAIAVGFWADSKGRTGFSWGLLAVAISPLLAGIILFFSLQKNEAKLLALKEEEKKAELIEKQRQHEEKEAELARTTITSEEFTSEIGKLCILNENGLLTEVEFSDRKQQVIKLLAIKKLKESSSDFLSALVPLMKRSAFSAEELVEVKKYIL